MSCIPWAIYIAGKTKTRPEEAEQVLSFANLQHDFVALIKQLFPVSAEAPDLIVSLEPSNTSSYLPDFPHSNQLLGHSMGASPVMSAAPLLQQEGYKIVGVVVLDVVEGKLFV